MLDDLLNAAKRHLGHTGLAIGDDFRALEARLAPGERIEHHVRGHDGDDRLLWAATSHRLFLVERETFEREVREVGWGDVRHLDSRPGPWGSTLVLTTARKRYRIQVEGADVTAAEAFAAFVRDRLGHAPGFAAPAPLARSGVPPTAATTPASAASGPEPSEARALRVSAALRELAALRNEGLLTQEEFDAEKRRLLAADGA